MARTMTIWGHSYLTASTTLLFSGRVQYACFVEQSLFDWVVGTGHGRSSGKPGLLGLPTACPAIWRLFTTPSTIIQQLD
jgi:hypothetical protein